MRGVTAVRGLRQALVLLLAAGAFGLVVAGLWTLLRGGGRRPAFGLTRMVIGALLALTGSNMLSRAGSAEERAFLGLAPEHEDPDSGEGLTAVGVFLFVSVPLFVAGGLLHGAG